MKLQNMFRWICLLTVSFEISRALRDDVHEAQPVGLHVFFWGGMVEGKCIISTKPRDPMTLSEDDWRVQSPSKSKVFNVFKFHYPSQKVIGSLG